MNCTRCGYALPDTTLVCSHCGAVVGLKYGPAHERTSFPEHKHPPQRFSPPLAGAAKRLPARVKGMLTSPRNEWKAIAAEPVGAMDIWAGYVLPLALIGPAALAIAQVAFGTAFPLVGVVKAALVTGVAVALLTFAFALVQVAVLAWGVNALALKFDAVPDPLSALKVVAYSMTPVWIVGILYLIPALAFLWVLAAIYAVFLAFVGLQVLMQCTPQKALGYTIATMGIGFALWVATGAIVTALMGFGPVMLE